MLHGCRTRLGLDLLEKDEEERRGPALEPGPCTKPAIRVHAIISLRASSTGIPLKQK